MLQKLARVWDSLAEGWRDLMSRSAGALTHFRRKPSGGAVEVIPADAPRWSLLAGDVIDAGRELVVRLELPGVAKEDCQIHVDGDTLYVRGEKRSESSFSDGDSHVRQCAYGLFERVVPLPRKVRAERAQANFRHGVLTVRLPAEEPRRIRIA